MRVRKLLLIHPKRSTRALIKKYIFSELSDIEVQESDGTASVMETMDDDEFDVIILPDHLTGMSITQFKTHQIDSKANPDTPLIVISESESQQQCKELMELGFDRVVQLRMRPAELIRMINLVCDPREWRKDERYHIPGAGVSLNMWGLTIEAGLINMSRGGILVEMATDKPEQLMKNQIDISLQIPMTNQIVTVDGLNSKLLRVEVVKWQSDLIPSVMRATFVFHDLHESVHNKLDELIQMAREDRLQATEVK